MNRVKWKEMKELEKEFIKTMRALGKERGYGHRDQRLFKREGEVFVCISYGFIAGMDTHNFDYNVYIKNYSYDNIFWKIMNMESNCNEPESLRAVGAFSAPKIMIAQEFWMITGNVEYYAEKIFKQAEERKCEFLRKNSVNDYVMQHDEIIYSSTLKVLAYIDMGMEEKAKELAAKELKAGKSGGFENEGRDFFDWVAKKPSVLHKCRVLYWKIRNRI